MGFFNRAFCSLGTTWNHCVEIKGGASEGLRSRVCAPLIIYLQARWGLKVAGWPFFLVHMGTVSVDGLVSSDKRSVGGGRGFCTMGVSRTVNAAEVERD